MAWIIKIITADIKTQLFVKRNFILIFAKQLTPIGNRRDARAVEWDGLENRCTGNGTVGSNPTLSAKIINLKIRQFEDLKMRWNLNR